MLRIWGRRSALNVQKVLWCAGELRLPHERIDAGQHFGVVNEPAYRALNPNGRIPTMEEDGLVLWESNAIVRYLSAKHGAGVLCPGDLRVHAEADKWMDWQAGTLYLPTFRRYYLTVGRTPPEQQDRNELAELHCAVTALFSILDAHLAKQPYVAGQKFTMGDIPVGTTLDKWMRMPIERPPMEHLEAYYRRLSDRPAYREHVLALAYNAV